MEPTKIITLTGLSVTLTFTLPTELCGCSPHIAVLAFTSCGEPVKKIPRADVLPGRRRKSRITLSVPRETETICLLASTTHFSISGINTYLHARHFANPGLQLWYAERHTVPEIAGLRTTDSIREARQLQRAATSPAGVKISLGVQWREQRG